ncbi:hypothetical protein [Streptomyces sp. NPDC048277]|uniref:hypothetical protein n=1 Tax=Streptomyces sp. NPDC048277 TaxID=3155027 RepID=UPI00340BB27A
MDNHGFSRGSIDRRDNARFTPQDATEYCWGKNFPIGQYVHELSAGVGENDLSRPEQDALWRAELRFAQDAYAMYLYDPSGRPGPEGAPQYFNFDTNEVFLVDAFGNDAEWPETPPLPGYPADPAADNDQLPAYFYDRGQDLQSHTPWQAPDLPPAYTPPQQPAPAQPVNAGYYAPPVPEQSGRRRSARIQARDAAEQSARRRGNQGGRQSR